MKRRFSKILGVGLTLALLFSLLLVAAPVSADVSEPSVILDESDAITDPEAEISAINKYTITFDVTDEVPLTVQAVTLSDDGVGIAGWSAAGVANSGAYSVKLHLPSAEQVADAARVAITMPADTTLNDISDLSFYWKATTPTTNTPKPYIIFEMDVAGTGTWVIMASNPEESPELPTSEWFVAGGQTDWGEETGALDFPHWHVVSDVEGYQVLLDPGNLSLLKSLDEVKALNDETSGDDLGDIDVLSVKIAIGESGSWPAATDAYIDDVTINGTTYDLDWGIDEDNSGDATNPAVDEFGAIVAGTISIEFPEGTILDVDDVWNNGDVTVQSSIGLWGTGFANDETDVGSDVVTTDEDDIYTVTIGLVQLEQIIAEGATVRVKFVGDQIINPDEPGDYTLWVSTSEEDEPVESEAYTIDPPDIDVPAGVVRLFNPSGIEFQSKTGDDAIHGAIIAAGNDWSIVIGEGRYATEITCDLEGLTISGAAGADVLIEADMTVNGEGFTLENVTIDGTLILNELAVDADSATIDSCNFEGGQNSLVINAADVEIIDSTFTVEEGDIGIAVNKKADATITDCTFNVEEDGTAIDVAAAGGGEVDDCTFDGDGGLGLLLAGDTDVTGCTFDGLDTALEIVGGTQVIEDCTFDGLDTAIDIATGAVAIKFNSILVDTDDVGIDAADGVAVDAAFNWWGTTDADDIGDMITGTGTVAYEPFLAGTAEAVFSASDYVTGENSLDAEDTVGVEVKLPLGVTADTIVVAKYTANPQEAIADDAIAFYDVYVVGTDAETVSIKFYAGDAQTELYIWSASTQTWGEITGDDVGYSAYGGYVWVTVDADMLDGTPFALVAGEAEVAEVAELLAPTINAPESGDDTVSLTPTFAWGAVTGADDVDVYYYFQFADNANFVPPLLAKLDGDLGRLMVTAYAYRTELPYSTAYYWRVKAVSGTEAAGDLAEGDWASAVFITKAEPEEPIPPVEIVEAPELPDITIEQPDITIEMPEIIVPLPDVAAAITPAWIYVIIAVGGVLVIALLVLIVRTRRVA